MDDHDAPPIQLQIPNFIYSSGPTLVPGGGAEIVPPDWFANNSLYAPAHSYNTTTYHQQHQQESHSSSAPFDFADDDIPVSFHQDQQQQQQPDLSLLTSLSAPSSLGLPVYSASGFDLLSIFARIANRPNPRVVLGPVDLTCSFVIVDVRRFDHPIVYCSPTFCQLTGYKESEVLNRNCRFLQAPPGQVVVKGERRTFTSHDAVVHLKKSLVADKECQTSIVNYKKNGAAFINLVTVIPVPAGDEDGDDDGEYEEGVKREVRYHVGFQVDLTEQPNVILDKLREGSYVMDYAAQGDPAGKARARSSLGQQVFPSAGYQSNQQLQQSQQQQLGAGLNTRDRKANAIPPVMLSKELKKMLMDPVFLRSFRNHLSDSSESTSSTMNASQVHVQAQTQNHNSPNGGNHILHLFLLSAAPDFVHVVSLKGSFLYVAPSVRRVLGYEAEEMVGRSIVDYAHPDDVVPMMRELKESSSCSTMGIPVTATGATANTTAAIGTGGNGLPRSVDLLFRAKTKMGRYVWVECRGRLHVEPGKGRKAIVLTGRAREMMYLGWDNVRRAGGRAVPRKERDTGKQKEVENDKLVEEGKEVQEKDGASTVQTQTREVEQEAWGTLGGFSSETATFLSVGQGMRDVLGWSAEELVGTRVGDVVCGQEVGRRVGDMVSALRRKGKEGGKEMERFLKMRCAMRARDGRLVDVVLVLYRADAVEESELGGEEDEKTACMDGEAGASISRAPLVYQIRLAEADTVACGLSTMTAPSSASMGMDMPMGMDIDLGMDMRMFGSQQQQQQASSASGSSLLPLSTINTSDDIFDELSIARGSSWQYELQQLVYDNAKLERQIAELEAREVVLGLAGVGVSPPSAGAGGTRSYEMYEDPAPGEVDMDIDAFLGRQQQQHLPHQQRQQQQQQQLFSHQPLSLPPSYHYQQQQQPSLLQLDPSSMQAVGMGMPLSMSSQSQSQAKDENTAAAPSSDAPAAIEAYLHHPQPQPKFSLAHIARGLDTPPSVIPVSTTMTATNLSLRGRLADRRLASASLRMGMGRQQQQQSTQGQGQGEGQQMYEQQQQQQQGHAWGTVVPSRSPHHRRFMPPQQQQHGYVQQPQQVEQLRYGQMQRNGGTLEAATPSTTTTTQGQGPTPSAVSLKRSWGAAIRDSAT
ncbi:hypothetical protein D9613_011686 [Agrocybe pediades]|uniref:PAS domain-containing protein n=1 Tax=Agrocybe pediades TaxID=84607 RepID=A0A8H4QWQ9_9AGAR|nr:hypothetical protein D9613_011686 [Agrocybe pediades]